ncbi:phosphoenolpyruvate synthase [Nocardiopsis sp. RV163]|uniref:phosphoenolpyruvate synthase n=1 Tax=Nocardiopsis sp. RV163 TaxID=1661388 RepID=UPI00064C08FF|nr:phosphoenolpyruvate synthase [Nocardiopsis sp. RV163]
MTAGDYVVRLDEVGLSDLARVGGKNASLGEMIRCLSGEGIAVPGGFATTAAAYRRFLGANRITDRIAGHLGRLDRGAPVAEVGAAVRRLILDGDFPGDLRAAILDSYAGLAGPGGDERPSTAVRSSATAEDLPGASFAGQQDSFLNVVGDRALLEACKRCYASLFNDRAIGYRRDRGFDHLSIALSVGVQPMVRADLACAGVAFTVDTETGFPHNVAISAAYGLGEGVVSGAVDPDQYTVFKPALGTPGTVPLISRSLGGKEQRTVYADSGQGVRAVPTRPEERRAWALGTDEVLTLARWAVAIEDHYGTHMDIEWAKDGLDGRLLVVQARPETVHSQRSAAAVRRYRLTGAGRPLVTGQAVGEAVAAGPACVLRGPEDIGLFRPGSVLVTAVTAPDWEPVMRRAAAIVTDHGGRTSHAAIVSRELGLPAVVGTGEATRLVRSGRELTVSCAEGATGRVYPGLLEYESREVDMDAIPATRTAVRLNLADPDAALRWWRLPADGAGLVRIEFVVSTLIRVHPMALLHPERLDAADRTRVASAFSGYPDGPAFFVDRLAQSIALIAASRWPDPVLVRTSDFKSNEYARLLGGRPFEPHEENPMIGWRGASRYHGPGYGEAFALECRAIARVRTLMGLGNVEVMIPFCRTLTEADLVLSTMADAGLRRGDDGLRVHVMAEIPANVVLATEFADRFDGFSVGSNDLTQLTLGVDRDSDLLADVFDERDPAVVRSIERLIADAHAAGRTVGVCGQRPGDDPEYAGLLVEAGIDSVSVAPDSFPGVKENIASAERRSGH